jgi:WD40 repeat protein
VSDEPIGTDTLTTPDGRFTAQINPRTGRITVFDATTHAVVRSVTVPPRPPASTIQNHGPWAGISPDSKRLLIVEGDSLVVYSMPDLAVEHRLELPVPASLGPPPHAIGISVWASSALSLDATRAVVLHAGVLTEWDLTTGRPVGTPLPLRSDPAGERRSAVLAFLVQQPRPHHADDVLVVEPDGSVEVWRLARRQPIAKAAVDAALEQGSVVFLPDGSTFAATSRDGQLQVWDIDHNRPKGRTIPIGSVDNVLGFTPDGKLITLNTLSSDPSAQIWDDESGKLLGAMTVPADVKNWNLTRNVLTAYAPGLVRTVTLDPAAWFKQLCALSDRPYTNDEKAVLAQDNATDERPCG